MPESKRHAAAERENPAVPPMRDADADLPAGAAEISAVPGAPAVPGGAVPGGGVVVDPAEHGRAGEVEPHTAAPAPVRIKRTRISGLWVGVTVAAVILLLLLVFIVQNNSYVTIYFFGWGGTIPLGVALLLGAICGVLLVAIPGYGRIIQLRRSFRKAAKRG